jgi:hypothetical protein
MPGAFYCIVQMKDGIGLHVMKQHYARNCHIMGEQLRCLPAKLCQFCLLRFGKSRRG